MKLQKDLREFVELLNSKEVDYIIVGGHAVAYHGYPRFTGDIDFLVRSSAENAQRLVAVIREFGFGDVSVQGKAIISDPVVKPGPQPECLSLATVPAFVAAVDLQVIGYCRGPAAFVAGARGDRPAADRLIAADRLVLAGDRLADRPSRDQPRIFFALARWRWRSGTCCSLIGAQTSCAGA